MKNYIRVFCLLSACFGLSACGNEYTQTFNTYKEICEFSGGTYIGDNDDNIGKCKCGNNIPCNPGVACINGKCADDTIVNVICEEKAIKCIGGATQICKNKKWVKDKDCDHKGCAVDALDCAECTGDEVICEESTLKVCSRGRWLKTSCQLGCAPDLKSCAVCLNDTIRCNENIRERCENGKWVKHECPSERPYCSKGECLDVECRDNAETCRDGKMMICSADNTYKENPNKICDSNICSGEECLLCNEKDTKCDNGMISVCSNNTWGEAKNCPGDYSCMDEKSCSVCKNDQTKCEGNVQYTCTDGKWDEGKNCPDGCKNDKCIETSNKCDDSDVPKCIPNSDGSGQMQICTNGSWVLDRDCLRNSKQPVSCNKSNTECGECKNDDMQCINNDKIGQKQVCKDGSWVLDRACLNDSKQPVSCNKSNTECGVCIHEDKDCIDDNGIGKERDCEYGTWKETTPCQNVSCNSDKHKCGVCKNGETRCTDNAEQKCENGDWITTTVCPLGCNWNKKECKCRNDDYRCNINGSLEKCEGGTWSQSYSMNACTCKDNTNNVGVFTDNNNTLSKTYNCIHNFSCNGETKCGECTNGTKAYGNGDEFKCKNGKWEGNMIEKPCDNDEESCIGWGTLPTDTKEKYYKFKCINNRWVNIDVCQKEGCQNCWGDVT